MYITWHGMCYAHAHVIMPIDTLHVYMYTCIYTSLHDHVNDYVNDYVNDQCPLINT